MVPDQYAIVDSVLVNGFLAQYACQACIALVMAILLFSLHRWGRRAVMAYWGLAWASQAAYFVCAGVSMHWALGGYRPEAWLRISMSVLSLLAAGMQSYCMLKGWLSIGRGRPLRVRRLLVAVMLIFGCAYLAANIVHQPDFGSAARFKIEVCGRSVVLGLIYLVVGCGVLRKRKLSRWVRYWLSSGLALLGLRYLTYGLLTWAHSGPSTFEAEFYLQFVDLVLHVFVGTGMMLWVSSEHVARSNAQARELEHRATLLSKQDRRLSQKQRLESIGRVSAGVAHDFNNLLTVILGWTEIMRNESDLDETVVEGVDGIANAAKQAGAMTQQLLLYGGKQVLQPTLEDPATIIQETCSMARSLEARNLAVDVEDGLPLVRIDRTHLTAALQNLIVNAMDATGGSGKIRVSAREVIYEDSSPRPIVLDAGEYVEIAVSDDGGGVTEEHISKIFEPFFSTKEMGNGLGLASAQGFAKQSGGTLEVESVVGEGATFTLSLPAATAESPTPNLEISGLSPSEVSSAPHKRVVVLVDDQPAIVRYARRVLNQAGYETICAGSAEACLAAVSEMKEPPGLLITDVIMPKVSGTSLAVKMRERFPFLGVIFMSGYAGVPDMPGFGGGSAPVLLQKPVASATLLKAVADHFRLNCRSADTA